MHESHVANRIGERLNHTHHHIFLELHSSAADVASFNIAITNELMGM